MNIPSITNTTLTINVCDLDQSIKFYEGIGLKLDKRWDDHYAEMKAPGMTIGLHPAKEHTPSIGSGNTSIGFTCTNFEKAKTTLLALSITVKERNEEGGSFLHFQDPDGTALYFIDPKW